MTQMISVFFFSFSLVFFLKLFQTAFKFITFFFPLNFTRIMLIEKLNINKKIDLFYQLSPT